MLIDEEDEQEAKVVEMGGGGTGGGRRKLFLSVFSAVSSVREPVNQCLLIMVLCLIL